VDQSSVNTLIGGSAMFYAGIDVAMDKHDCVVLDSGGNIVFEVFTFENSRDGFRTLKKVLQACSKNPKKIKVGLEATGHYSDNILAFLNNSGYDPVLFNPLHTNLFRKGLSLRKTKTDHVDAHTIATMLRTEDLKSYSQQSYHLAELKSLTRYRSALVSDCSRHKISLVRLCQILFPEIKNLVPTLHMSSVYTLLSECPSADKIANCNLTHLTSLLSSASKGHYGRDKAIEIRDAARKSIGIKSTVKELELKQTIDLIQIYLQQIETVDEEINKHMDEIESPITSIPGIANRMAAVILAETNNFQDFERAEQVLAFAGLDPSVYQSGQLTSTHSKMVKRGSKYLRYAIFNAAKYVCHWDPTFRTYLHKKRAEGKPYNVAVSHAAKKLTRVMFHLVKTNKEFISQA
jgi:transposase